jgi:hypothetical protein
MLELAAVQRAIIRVVQVGVRVPENCAWNMALVVCCLADIHFDHANIVIAEVFRKPGWLHEHTQHCCAIRQFHGPPFYKVNQSYEEEAFLTAMVARMLEDIIVKSTEILRGHYVDFARRKKRCAYVE